MAELALDLAEKGGCIEVLMQKAKKSGNMDSKELIECINSYGDLDQDQIDAIYKMIEDLGFKITNGE